MSAPVDMRTDADAPVVIAAGGTGGHVVPALAVADVLATRGIPVVWLGTKAGLESRLVPAAGIEIRWIDVAGLRGKGAVDRLLAPLRIARACLQSAWELRRLRPRAVLGMGGFVSGPVALAALARRCPLVLHEQNAIPGMTNRHLARFATRVFSAWPGVFAAGVAARAVGNPVRRDMAERAGRALPVAPAEAARADTPGQATGATPAPLRILVVGGSRGARALNEIVPAAAALLGARIRAHHQSGTDDVERVAEHYASSGVSAIVEPFVQDMAHAYAACDLVVCRSGAMTVTELAALGVPSILVPFPHAVDDHQTANARRLSDTGAAVLMPQSALTPTGLAAEIRRFDEDRAALAAMRVAARATFVAGAAEAVADALSGEASGRHVARETAPVAVPGGVSDGAPGANIVSGDAGGTR